MNELRFDWLPPLSSPVMDERVQVVVDALLESYKSGRGVPSKESYTAIYTPITRQILSSLYQSYNSYKSVSFPLHNRHYDSKNLQGIKFSYRHTKDVYNKLLELNWIVVTAEGVENQNVTRIAAAGDLKQAFKEWGLRWMLPELLPEQDCVELRDVVRNADGTPKRTGKKKKTKKINLAVPDTEEIKQHRQRLTWINNKLRQHCISIDLSNENLLALEKELAESGEADRDNYRSLHLQRVQLTRIFSRGEMNLGGRFYRGWWQSIPGKHRPHIRIDGKKTIEVDYSGMSLSIIYALNNVPFNAGDDHYDIGLKDWTGTSDPRRKPLKRTVNALINDQDGVYRVSKSELRLFGETEDSFMDKLLTKHPVLKDRLGSSIGLETQFIDSQIAEAVMIELLKEDIVVLPIHDSFIVRAGYQQYLETAMSHFFKLRLGADIKVESEVVKINDHFGWDNDDVVQAHNDDPNVRIVNAASVRNKALNYHQQLTNNYLSHWEPWMHTDEAVQVSSLLDTSLIGDV